MGEALKAIAVKPAYTLIYKTKKAREAFLAWRYFHVVQPDDWNFRTLNDIVDITSFIFYPFLDCLENDEIELPIDTKNLYGALLLAEKEDKTMYVVADYTILFDDEIKKYTFVPDDYEGDD